MIIKKKVLLTHWDLGGLLTTVTWAFLGKFGPNLKKQLFTYSQSRCTTWKIKSYSFIWYVSNNILTVLNCRRPNYTIFRTVILLPCSIKKWKYGHGEKNRVRDNAWFWLYYPQNMKKSHFPKSVCVSVCLSMYRIFYGKR